MSPQDLLKDYPYYAYAALQALKETDSPEERAHLKGILAANIGSETALREMLDLNSESFVDFYKDSVTPTLSTDDTIDAFLDRFGGKEEVLSPMPPSDYASTLLSSVDEPLPDLGLPSDSPFLKNSSVQQKSEAKKLQSKESSMEKSTEGSTNSEGLTESFARILIKNRNYKKALEIIEELNLKNTEKSVYFADQIRFLKKLIITQSKTSGASR